MIQNQKLKKQDINKNQISHTLNISVDLALLQFTTYTIYDLQHRIITQYLKLVDVTTFNITSAISEYDGNAFEHLTRY